MKNSSISCSRSIAFIAVFACTVAATLLSGEATLRSFIFAGSGDLIAKRIAAVYEHRSWPVLGDSHLENVLIGDSQMYTGFLQHPDFFQLALSGETAPMLEILVREYFRFRTPKKVIIEAGPQFFAQAQLNNGTRRHEFYFAQNNWIQHATGIRSYLAEPGIGSHIGEALNVLLAPYRRQWIEAVAAADRGREAVPAPAHWGVYSADERRTAVAGRIAFQRPVQEFLQTSHWVALKNMAAFLHAAGATLCFLRLPVVSEYLEAIADDPDYRGAIQAFQDLAMSHKAPYVDFRPLPMPYRPEYFLNQDHLNEAGSAVFAPLAIKECFGDPKGSTPTH
jgi:hypothetical protein